MGDRTLGVAGIALAAFYIWSATLIEESFISDPVGPKAFPYIIGGLLAISSVAVVLRPDPAPVWPAAARLLEIAVAVALLIAYGYALPAVGFVIATTVGAAYLSWRLGTAPLQALLAGVATALGIYVVFHLGLGLSLAKGPLGI